MRYPMDHVSSAAPRIASAARIRTSIAAVLVLALSACGFQLRGSAQMPFSSMYVQVADSLQVGHELKRALRVNNTKLVDSPAAAQTTLVILSEIKEKQILSLGGQGRVREYQLRLKVIYAISDARDRSLVEPAEIVLNRLISYDDRALAAKEQEEQFLYRDMQSEATQQILRRLAQVKPLP